jgi:DNA-directed RNA polymerase specialized sigma24 family protein
MYDFIENHFIENRQRILKRMTFRAGGPEAAEDIVQTAYERALRYYKTCDLERFNQWFAMLLNNALRDYKNEEKGYSNIEVDEDENVPISCPHYSERIMSEIYELIETKSEVQIEVLTLHLQHGYRAVDIARITDHSYAKCHHIIERFSNEIRELYNE